jgi:sugar phosphate permease
MVPKYDMKYRWIILIIVSISQFVLSIVSYGWGPLAPFLKEVMLLNNMQIGLISTIFFLASAISAFPAGVFVDSYGTKIGLMSWLLATGFPLFFLSFFYHSYIIFLIIIGMSGFGYGIGNPVASKSLFIWFNKKVRGTVFGIRQSAVTFGGAVAGILLVYISQKLGPFRSLNIIAWITVILTLVVLVFYRGPSFNNENCEIAGRSEVRIPAAGGLGNIFSNMAFLNVCFIGVMLGLSQSIVSTFLILYISKVLGYSLISAGGIFTVLMVSGATGRLLWGLVSDRFFGGSRKAVLVIISLLGLISVTSLTHFSGDWPPASIFIVAVALGISTWGWNAIFFVTVAELTEGRKTGTSVGLATTFGWLGISLGPICFGSIADHFGYFLAWTALSISCAICFMLSIFMPVSNRLSE